MGQFTERWTNWGCIGLSMAWHVEWRRPFEYWYRTQFGPLFVLTYRKDPR